MKALNAIIGTICFIFTLGSHAAVPPDYHGKPFEDAVYHVGPQVIPGKVECAYFDIGGEGVAYHDTDATSNGNGVLNQQSNHQRPHATPYHWNFRTNEGVDLSYTKDFADFKHNQNMVSPSTNQFYIGWAENGEWCNYTVDVKMAGAYKIIALYGNDTNSFQFSVNHWLASDCKFQVATGSMHKWNKAEVGTITFAEAGLQLLTLYFNKGNNFAYFEFEPSVAASERSGSPEVRLPISFEAPGKGFVSLALYDEDGVMTRSLLYAEPMEKGRRTVEWDGTTDLGKPAAAGTYTAKGVFFTEGPVAKFEMIVGKSGNPPWRTADGKGDWGGNLGFPSSLVSNGKSLVMGYAAVEDNQITGVQQMDGDGNILQRHFTFYPWDGRSAAAMDESNLYLGIFNGDKKTVEIAAYKLGEPRGKILSLLPVKPWPEETETRWNGRLTAGLDGLALTSDALFATVAKNDALFIVDRATGALHSRVTLPDPHGIVAAGGRLLVISGKRVLRLTLEGKTEATVVDESALTFPHALAIDGAGNIYVGDSGAGGPAGPTTSQGTRQVFVFSPMGKLLRKIGQPGGAPQEGRFDENGLGIITALCVGPGAEGKGEALWVNDIATGFPRTSRWSLDGKLERQWFARKLALFSDVLNPARPNELIYTSDAFADEPGISAYEMDLAKKTWRPAWHYDTAWADMYQEDVFLSFSHGGNPLNGPRGKDARWPSLDYGSRNFVSHGGRNYFMNGEGAIHLYAPEHKPKLAALVFTHRAEKTAEGKIHGSYD